MYLGDGEVTRGQRRSNGGKIPTLGCRLQAPRYYPSLILREVSLVLNEALVIFLSRPDW